MLTPYDWQEGIGNRSSYIENKLAQGAPVLAISLAEGILVFTYRRQPRKIFEVYDRLLFSGIGQQSDLEALRVAAVDFAHQEGYQRSEEDVTIQRVVTALSQPIKRAFGDFNSAPVVARVLFAEVQDVLGEDRYYVLDFDGDFRLTRGHAAVAGDQEGAKRLAERLASIDSHTPAQEALAMLQEIWPVAFAEDEEPPSMEDLTPEAVLLERSTLRENRFTWLLGEDAL